MSFECPRCDFKCNIAHELSDHKQKHSNSYADWAKSPPRFGYSASQPTTSTPQHHTSDTPYGKRAASVSPNSGNIQRKRTNWTNIGEKRHIISFKPCMSLNVGKIVQRLDKDSF